MVTTTRFVWDEVQDAYLSELDGANNVQAVYTNEPQHYGEIPIVESRCGAVVPVAFRFHIPLVEPDVRISRIRLSFRVDHVVAHGRRRVCGASWVRPSSPCR